MRPVHFLRLLCSGLAVALALVLSACEEDKAVTGPVDSGPDFSAMVLSLCQSAMPRTDCACFWQRSQGVYTAENITAVLEALAERDQYPPVITRGRLMAALGEDRYTVLNRALFRCVRA